MSAGFLRLCGFDATVHFNEHLDLAVGYLAIPTGHPWHRRGADDELPGVEYGTDTRTEFPGRWCVGVSASVWDGDTGWVLQYDSVAKARERLTRVARLAARHIEMVRCPRCVPALRCHSRCRGWRLMPARQAAAFLRGAK